MIEKGKTYNVYDGEGRCWGSVTLDYPFSESTFGSNTISGYLKATPEFEQVQHIFLEHEKFMSEAGSIDDKENNSHVIASLGVELHDPETGKKQNVDPVFVSNKLLFTCDAYVNEI